jgi:transposase
MGGNDRKNRATAVIAALAAGSTVREAAAKAGVGEATVYRWLHRPDFRRRVDRLRSDMLTEAAVKLAALATWTVGQLRELAEHADGPAVRLAACRAILDNLFRANEQVGILDRLDALETAAAAQKGGKP